MYLKVQSLIEFDTFVITHGPFTSVDSGEQMYTSFIIFWNKDKYEKYTNTYRLLSHIFYFSLIFYD